MAKTLTIDELAERHAQLLSVERECELEQAALDSTLQMKRDARLVVVRVERSAAMGGRASVLLKRRSDLPLALGRVGVGDVVALRPVSAVVASSS